MVDENVRSRQIRKPEETPETPIIPPPPLLDENNNNITESTESTETVEMVKEVARLTRDAASSAVNASEEAAKKGKAARRAGNKATQTARKANEAAQQAVEAAARLSRQTAGRTEEVSAVAGESVIKDDELAPSVSSVDTAGEEKQLVVFNLGGEAYAVDITAVREIIQMQPITGLPDTAHFMEGVINLRGRVITVMDLRKRFGLGEVERSKESRIVILNIEGQEIGIIVDSVTEVLHVPANLIEPSLPTILGSGSQHLLGTVRLPDRLLILLEPSRALFSEDNPPDTNKIN